MIVDNIDAEVRYSIDLGRPSFTTDETRELLKSFFQFVRETDIPLMVNGMHDTIESMVNNGTSYLGGGFGFCYYFRSKEDRKRFAKEVERLADWQVTDWRNITLFSNPDKSIDLLFSEKYLPSVQRYLDAQSYGCESYGSGGYASTLRIDSTLHTFHQGSWENRASGGLREILELRAYLEDRFFDLD
jgi:hypothetical protein